MKQYYKFTNEHDEAHYGYGTPEDAAKFLDWLCWIGQASFTMCIAKKEDERFAVDMSDVFFKSDESI